MSYLLYRLSLLSQSLLYHITARYVLTPSPSLSRMLSLFVFLTFRPSTLCCFLVHSHSIFISLLHSLCLPLFTSPSPPISYSFSIHTRTLHFPLSFQLSLFVYSVALLISLSCLVPLSLAILLLFSLSLILCSSPLPLSPVSFSIELAAPLFAFV